MTNYEIRKHIDNQECQKKDYARLLEQIINLHESSPLRDSTINEIRAKVSGKIAQCDISIRDHNKLIVKIECHCEGDDVEDCYADCKYVYRP